MGRRDGRGRRTHRWPHTRRPLAAAGARPLQFCPLCLLCHLQFSLSDPKQLVQLGERFQSPLVPGSVPRPRLGTLLHSLLQLQLHGEGNRQSSEIWGKPATEYFVTDYLRKGKRADCDLSGAITNALLLLGDRSKMSSEPKKPPAVQRGRYRKGASTKAVLELRKPPPSRTALALEHNKW